MTITTIAASARSRIETDTEGPRWLAEARLAALSWVAEKGFPTRKDEDWKYTRLAPIVDAPFQAVDVPTGNQISPSELDAAGLDLGGARLVFVNGFLDAGLSRTDDLPVGATVTGLAEVIAGRREHLEAFFAPESARPHAFAALNDALAEDGAFIHLAPGTHVDKPIQLVFRSAPGDIPLMSSPRSVVLADAGSRATIVETYGGPAGVGYCTNAVTEMLLGPGAAVEHYKVQDEPESTFHLALLDVRQQRDSRFESHSVMLGSRLARHEVRVRLEDVGAQVSLDGLYLPQGEQVHDNTIFVDHVAGNCTSHQLYKGVLGGTARGVFNGHIMVRPGADGTDANQQNMNLILSDRAEVDTRPRLEIYADDVVCTHGAAVGQLDEEAVLYLCSRGLSQQAARGMLVTAFVHEMLDRIRLQPLRAAVETMVAGRVRP